ncbi:hypothetical protein, partial [Roseibium sp.]
PNLKIRPNKTNFLELRSKNLVASDVAAVDEPRYTHHQQNRQQLFLIFFEKIFHPQAAVDINHKLTAILPLFHPLTRWARCQIPSSAALHRPQVYGR